MRTVDRVTERVVALFVDILGVTTILRTSS